MHLLRTVLARRVCPARVVSVVRRACTVRVCRRESSDALEERGRLDLQGLRNSDQRSNRDVAASTLDGLVVVVVKLRALCSVLLREASRPSQVSDLLPEAA